MSEDDLHDYYHFLQKRNAKRATRLTIEAHSKVMKIFSWSISNLIN